MADEKEPHLDPSESNEEQADTSGTHDAGTDQELDAETRMLQQIAALGGADSAARHDVDAQDATDPSDTNDAAEDDGEEDTDQPAEEIDTGENPTLVSPVVAGASGAGGDDGDDGVKPVRKKRRWPWVLLVVVVLLGIGYVGAAYATKDTVPSSLTIEGIDVSGLSTDEAASELEEQFAARSERELVVTASDDAEASVVPADAGFSYDTDATLDQLTGLTFNPVKIWDRLFGGANVSAVTSVDDEAAEDAVAGLTEQLTFDPTEGSVEYQGDELEYSAPVDGFTVDQQELADQLRANWLSEDDELAAPGQAVEPAVSAQQWEQFVDDTAQPLIDDAYSVSADDATAELAPAQLGAAAEVNVEEGDDGDTPVMSLDGEELADSLAENNAEFESTNKDATVELTGSAGSAKPKVVAGSSGRGVDPEQVADKLLADLNGDQTRAISVELDEVEPDVTTEEAEAWDVTHEVAEYSTPYPTDDEPRTANLRVGAQRVNGTVVMPGEEFNLDSILAPVTTDNGYHSSGVVESGVTTDAIGGGLSQIATMSYNAGFLGGMDIIEYKPHSRWFDRYPKGRESTYWEGQINVRWENDTDAPVVVEMWLADSKVHTRLWGSDYYDVSTTTSEPYNYTDSPTIRSSDQECVSESGGREGFTVDIDRTKTPPDGEAVEESWSWAYSGWPTVICENN